MNREKLVRKVLEEMVRVRKETDIDIRQLSDVQLSRWIEHLVRQCWE